MAVQDLWVRRDGTRSARYGRGKRWRVTHPRFTTRAFDDRHTADLYWAEVLRADREQAAAPLSATVGELLDQWLAGKRGLSDSGYSACRDAARYVLEAWRDTPATSVRRHQVEAWIAGLEVADRASRDGGLAPASASTRHKALQALAGALRIAVESEIVGTNPATGVRIARDQPRERHYLRADELRQLAAEAGPYAPMILLMGTTGLRIGEAIDLNVRDVDSVRRRIVVRRSKTRASREVPVAQQVLDALALARPGASPLFTSPGGHRLIVRNWRGRVFDPAVERIGRPAMTPHDLRHTAASLTIAAGADVKAVQRMLGHASATMTLDLYGHLWDERLDDVASAVGAAIWG